MRVLINSKTVTFIHLPRTGGSWVRSQLSVAGSVIANFGHNLNISHRGTAISTIRHPESWYPSFWAKFGKRSNKIKTLSLPGISDVNSEDFNEWASMVCDVFPGVLSSVYREQILPCKLFKTESLSETFNQWLTDCFGVGIADRDPVNVTSKSDLPSWDMGVLCRVIELEREAVSLWRGAA